MRLWTRRHRRRGPYPGPDRAGRGGRSALGTRGNRGDDVSGGGDEERLVTQTDTGSYDLVILGGGSGGYACALRAAELGMRVVLIEKDKVGGTCLHRGCIPTKALLHAAEVADHARDAASVGVRTTFDGIDMPAVNNYKDKVVDRLWKGLQGTLASRKVEIVYGDGRLVSATAVAVGDARYEGAHVVLATGSEARSLPGLQIDGQRVITSDHALDLDRVPASAVILGGGVIGVEFASVWRSFGAEVTIVEMLPHLLPPEEESSSKLLERAFRRRGIVRVDEYCRTNVPTISAVGDLIPGPQLAHDGFAEGIMVAERVGGLKVTPIDYDGVPRIAYSDPEVASVGITSAIAAERGIDTTEFTYNLGGNGKSVILQTQGAAKVIATAPEDASGQPGPVLGVHLVGARVGELIAEGQLIYNWDAQPSDVAQLIHPHPTQSEAIGEAHLALAGKPLHVHA